MKPARGLLLVRPVHTAETFAGGRIIVPDHAKARLTAWQCECLAVGDQEVCEDEDCARQHVDGEHPCPVHPGDWLVVQPRTFVDTYALREDVWVVRQDNVLAIVRP